MPSGRMVSPEKMVPSVEPDDFYEFQIDDILIYIQKRFIDAQREEIEFLIPYYGKCKIFVQQ